MNGQQLWNIKILGDDRDAVTMASLKDDAMDTSIETLVKTLQPLKDLAKNWDIDIANW